MIKAQGMFVAVMAIAGSVALAGDQSAKDLKRMEGNWIAEVQQFGGKPIPRADAAKIRIQLNIRGENYTVFVDDKQAGHGTMKLDATRRLATIDLNLKDGLNRGKQQFGIYKFDGNDQMKVVFADPGQTRPTGFETRPGTQEMLIVYRRQQ